MPLWYNIHIQSQNLGGVTAFSSNLHFGKITSQPLFYQTDDFSCRQYLNFASLLVALTLCFHWTSKKSLHSEEIWYQLWIASVCHIAIETEAQFPSVMSLGQVLYFVTPWSVACWASLSITKSQSFLRLMSIKSVMPSNYLILCCPLLCLQSFPASGSFPVSQLFTSGGQIIGASASVLPLNIQGWYPLELAGLIS